MDYLVIFGSMLVFFVIIGVCFLGVYQHWTEKNYYKPARRTTQPSTQSEKANGGRNNP